MIKKMQEEEGEEVEGSPESRNGLGDDGKIVSLNLRDAKLVPIDEMQDEQSPVKKEKVP